MTVQGFPSEQEGRDYLSRVWAGLMWLLLSRELSTTSALEPQPVAYAEDPNKAAENLSKSFGLPIDGPVDGLIDGSRPAVYPTSKRLRTITGGEVSVKITTPRASVLAALAEGSSFPRSAQLIRDDKLRVAFELYGAYFTESSSNARFLTLVMSLEALAIGTARPTLVLELLDGWKKQVEQIMSEGQLSTDEVASLESLNRELLFRREDSIRRQIFNLVLSTFQSANDTDAEKLAHRAKSLYDLRSKLVHEGKLPEKTLTMAVSDAKALVQRLLRVKYLGCVS
ncbi:MAG: HEPN domain-containing protein [Nitrospira sp.]|nr:HEPN domain-containing protein [Nitrospira sp.]MDH4301984.1 HEPN domain-containing protein [Nitrospira sp.]MDH5337616.1 HEPN domain-containing protein [Nitrospira sp.]